VQKLDLDAPTLHYFHDLFSVFPQSDPQRCALHSLEFQVDGYVRTFSTNGFQRSGKPIRPGSLKFIQEKYFIYGGVKSHSKDQEFNSS
jgi:hypothetical protein